MVFFVFAPGAPSGLLGEACHHTKVLVDSAHAQFMGGVSSHLGFGTNSCVSLAPPTNFSLPLAASIYVNLGCTRRPYSGGARGARRIRRLTDAPLGSQNALTTPQVAPSVFPI